MKLIKLENTGIATMNVLILACTIMCTMLFGFSNAIEYECGDNITASEGELTSMDFPSNYPHNMSCEVTLNSTENIAVLFTHMAIDCSDKLQIRDGNTDLMLAELCGFDLSYLKTETTYIKINFQTDEGLTNSGWRLVWDADMRERNDVITSGTPGGLAFVLIFPKNKMSAHFLTAQDGIADVNIANLDLRGNDKIIFFEEPSGKEIGSYGQNYTNYITSGTDSMSVWITMDSDSTNSAEGAVRWPADECLTNSFSESTGVITSHGYPDIYYGRRDYRWCINSATGKGINIHITDMNLQNPNCADEYVEVIDRAENSTLLKHCENKPIYLRTNSIFVVIIFHSSYSDGLGGWRLEWDDDDETTTTTTTTPTTTTTTPTTTTTTPTTTTATPTTTTAGFSPRPPSKYNDTPCETATSFYGVCQYNNIECVNGTYTDRLCRRPVNQGQIMSNVGAVYRSCCITGSASGYSAKQIV